MHSAPKRMAAHAAYGPPAPLPHSFDAYSHPSEAYPYPHRGAPSVVPPPPPPPLLQDGVAATADEVDSAVRQYFAHGQHPLPVGCDADAIKLFVGNIPKQMSEAELRSVFTHVGPVARVSLACYGHTSKSKGSAFVWFRHQQHAVLAILTMHGQLTLPRKATSALRTLTVRPALCSSQHRAPAPPPPHFAPEYASEPSHTCALYATPPPPPPPPLEASWRTEDMNALHADPKTLLEAHMRQHSLQVVLESLQNEATAAAAPSPASHHSCASAHSKRRSPPPHAPGAALAAVAARAAAMVASFDTSSTSAPCVSRPRFDDSSAASNSFSAVGSLSVSSGAPSLSAGGSSHTWAGAFGPVPNASDNTAGSSLLASGGGCRGFTEFGSTMTAAWLAELQRGSEGALADRGDALPPPPPLHRMQWQDARDDVYAPPSWTSAMADGRYAPPRGSARTADLPRQQAPSLHDAAMSTADLFATLSLRVQRGGDGGAVSASLSAPQGSCTSQTSAPRSHTSADPRLVRDSFDWSRR